MWLVLFFFKSSIKYLNKKNALELITLMRFFILFEVI